MFVKCTRMFVKDFEIELCIINLVNINILLFVVARPQATTCCNGISIMREACNLTCIKNQLECAKYSYSFAILNNS